MIDKIKERRRVKDELITQVISAGGRPQKRGRGNMFHCFQHNDQTASAWVKQSKDGYWYFRCFTCNFWMDVWDLEAHNKGIDVRELFKEVFSNPEPRPAKQFYYQSIPELMESLDAIAIEEVNPYTNPDTKNIDLLVIRYLPRGGNKKVFTQAYQTDKGFINKRPQGLLPLFNRGRIKEAEKVIFVEGEKAVRQLTDLGFVATTGSGGSSNADSQDYSPLAGKTVITFADNDEPGRNYMEQVRDKLRELDPPTTVFTIATEGLELPEGGDVVDLCDKILAEDGNKEDCINCIEALVDDASETNKLDSLEKLLEDMREGTYSNLPIKDFPILSNEAKPLLNKRITVIYGNAGFGKSLFIGKACDDLVLDERKVARLQLEDEYEQHLLRSLAQQAMRADLANDDFHRNNPIDSKLLYEQFKPTLDAIAPTVVAGEHETWDDKRLLNWIEWQLKVGKELVVVDPISVIMTDKIWITSHRLMWGTKKILAKYPNGRVVFISHNNTEGEVAGGQSYKRFCHTLLMLNKYKKPKRVQICDLNGELQEIMAETTIGIAKARYGRGSGLEVAVKLNPTTLTFDELGVIVAELGKETFAKPVGRNLESENAAYDIQL